MPTAALLDDNNSIVDYKLFWVTCRDTVEASYLLAIINSEALYQRVIPLMSKGLFGARDLQKHLWKLSIPEFDPASPLHAAIADAGAAAAEGAAQLLSHLRANRGDDLTSTYARREIHKWLAASRKAVPSDSVGGCC